MRSAPLAAFSGEASGDAWNNRYSSQEAFNHANAVLEKTLKKLEKAARAPRVDGQATADHEAVSAFVRGSSGKMPEGKPAPNFSKMTANEDRQAIYDQYRYWPNV